MGPSSPPQQTLWRAVPLETSGFGRPCPSRTAPVAGRVTQDQPFRPRIPSRDAPLAGAIPPDQGLRRAAPIHCSRSGRPYPSIIHLHTISMHSILTARTVCVSPPSAHVLQHASRSIGCPSPISQAQFLPQKKTPAMPMAEARSAKARWTTPWTAALWCAHTQPKQQLVCNIPLSPITISTSVALLFLVANLTPAHPFAIESVQDATILATRQSYRQSSVPTHRRASTLTEGVYSDTVKWEKFT
jgi:hypothetical protein